MEKILRKGGAFPGVQKSMLGSLAHAAVRVLLRKGTLVNCEGDLLDVRATGSLEVSLAEEDREAMELFFLQLRNPKRRQELVSGLANRVRLKEMVPVRRRVAMALLGEAISARRLTLTEDQRFLVAK